MKNVLNPRLKKKKKKKKLSDWIACGVFYLVISITFAIYRVWDWYFKRGSFFFFFHLSLGKAWSSSLWGLLFHPLVSSCLKTLFNRVWRLSKFWFFQISKSIFYLFINKRVKGERNFKIYSKVVSLSSLWTVLHFTDGYSVPNPPKEHDIEKKKTFLFLKEHVTVLKGKDEEFPPSLMETSRHSIPFN